MILASNDCCNSCKLLLLSSGAALVTLVQVVPQGIESVNGSDVNMRCTSPLVNSSGVMVTLVQVVPQGIESVNGSDVNMGCTSPLVNSSGVMVCNSSNCPSSYLLDGNSPAIDTSTSDWASQLVTVKKNDATLDIPYDHVVLTFGFDTAVSLTSIELDVFLCPEWNIAAPFISVYADEKNNLVFFHSPGAIIHNTPMQTSCDSLSTIAISFEELTTSPTWHIVASFSAQPDITWVYVGEVRFVDHNTMPSMRVHT